MTRGRFLFTCAFIAVVAIVVGCQKKTEPTSSEAPGRGPGPAPGPTYEYPTGDAETAGKLEAVKRHKQIGAAMYKYEKANGAFPAGIVGSNNELGLSWRVQLLPYLDEGELYKQFKLEESWDSAHNKPLLSKMPKVYESPGRPADPGETYLLSFYGELAFLRPLRESGKGGKQSGKLEFAPGSMARGRRVTEITDGTSNALMVVEAYDPVKWTKPEDFPFVLYGRGLPPVPVLSGVFKGGFHGLMCDGSVHFFPSSLPEKSIAPVITINGGEVLAADVSEIITGQKPSKDGASDSKPKEKK
jgi:hypothetical protein